MAEHDAPFAHVAYQQPDGTTGVMDNHDAEALHDEPGAVKETHIADGAVTNGKIAAGAVSSAELADGAVTAQTIADGAVGRDQLDPEIVESWDSVFQEETWTDPDGKVRITVRAGIAHILFLKPMSATAWKEERVCLIPERLGPAENHTGIMLFERQAYEPFAPVLVNIYPSSISLNPTNQSLSNTVLYGEVSYPVG